MSAPGRALAPLRWEQLLSDRRPRSERSVRDGRGAFERDYDRLVFCSAFRRLQDKAQVFPLDRGDFVRTRLTHSVEVSTLGRALGTRVGLWLRERGDLPAGREPHDLGTIVAAACLAHDLGNPPFGHHGEMAVGEWFQNWFGSDPLGQKVAGQLTEAERLDFLRYEGNAQGLRILVRLQAFQREWGLNLTLATCGAVIKYPCASHQSDRSNPIRKKFNYFQSERERYALIQTQLGLHDRRHPLTWLMEAADDICYSAIDIEDGLRRRVVDIPLLVMELEDRGAQLDGRRASDVLDGLYREQLRETESASEAAKAAIELFRVAAVEWMLGTAERAFQTHYDAIMAGDFPHELVSRSECAELCAALKGIGADHIYCCREVRELEVVGQHVVRALCGLFVPAVVHGPGDRLWSLISPSLKQAAFLGLAEPTLYQRLRLATDWIGGMTDRYARNTYRKLTGY